MKASERKKHYRAAGVMSKEGRWCTRLNGIEGVLFVYFRDIFAASEIDSERRVPDSVDSMVTPATR